ncbi:MAG: hypothetical protein HKN09_01015 [Saprospiraceae bacterium]|nr:hypothetical protein [Saprospiraceae bacterium]
MKHEWKKKDKNLYLPPTRPVFIDVPELQFITIKGEGNPGGDLFAEHVASLYAMAYGIKMSPKKGIELAGYIDYTVYPLEGIWDLNDEAKLTYEGSFNKDDLIYTLMIRQPHFVTQDYFSTIQQMVMVKKKELPISDITFEKIKDGPSIQMLHIGSYDTEPESFEKMEAFTKSEGLKRISKTHREIYLSDARRVSPEKLKTVLRFKVESE